MRKAVVPVAIIVLALGAWLITKDPEHAPVQDSSAVGTATEDRSPTPSDDARASIVPDEPTARDRLAEPPVLFSHQVPATPISQALEDMQMPPMPELVEAERAFAAERVDPAWANAMEGRFSDR